MHKQLIFATKNPGKIKNLRAAVAPAGYEVIGLDQYPDVTEALETGATAAANAQIKATHYAQTIGQPVISMDSALYFYDLPDSEQPGVNVRRIPGSTSRPTDTEMTDYYRELLTQHNGQLTGYWEYALAFAQPDGGVVVKTARTEDRILKLPGSSQHTPGQPLESFQFHAPLGKYLADMTEAEKSILWQEAGTIVLQLVRQLVG
jgi:inosine/xanthosine triphosphate pyrophosphatase family protein